MTGPRTGSLGPAALGFPVVGATVVGDRLVLVSRNVVPCQVAVFDLLRAEVRRQVEVPTGLGAWGVTATDGVAFFGQLGAQGQPNLYRYELEAGAVEAVAVIDAHHIWDLTTGADGVVYGVSAPTLVFAYDPATGLARDVGIADRHRDTVRSVTVASGRVVVGGTRDDQALLLAGDPGQLPGEDLLPEELTTHASIYTLATAGRFLLAGTRAQPGADAAVAVIDPRGEQPLRAVTVPGAEVIDAIVASDDAVYCSVRPSGATYRWQPAEGGLDEATVPVADAETRGLFWWRGRLVGVSAEPVVWSLRPGGELVVIELLAAGLGPGPELAQSLAADDERVYVGANFGVQVHHREQPPTRAFAPGEPKAMTVADDRLWLAMYPTGELWSLDAGADRARRVTALPDGQNRPTAVYHPPGSRWLLATSASDRLGGGALVRLDLDSQEVAVLLDPADRRYLATVTTVGDLALVGSGGPDPVLVAAGVDDLALRWTVPGPHGSGALLGLAALGDRLAGFTAAGWLVVFDLDTPGLANSARVSQGGGRLVATGDRLYAVTADALLRLDPDAMAAETVVDGLASRLWNWPFCAADPSGRLYVIAGTDLLQVDPTPADEPLEEPT